MRGADEMSSLTKIMIVASWLWIIFWCLALFFKDFQIPLALAGLVMLFLSATIFLWTIWGKKRRKGESTDERSSPSGSKSDKNAEMHESPPGTQGKAS